MIAFIFVGIPLICIIALIVMGCVVIMKEK